MPGIFDQFLQNSSDKPSSGLFEQFGGSDLGYRLMALGAAIEGDTAKIPGIMGAMEANKKRKLERAILARREATAQRILEKRPDLQGLYELDPDAFSTHYIGKTLEQELEQARHERDRKETLEDLKNTRGYDEGEFDRQRTLITNEALRQKQGEIDMSPEAQARNAFKSSIREVMPEIQAPGAGQHMNALPLDVLAGRQVTGDRQLTQPDFNRIVMAPDPSAAMAGIRDDRNNERGSKLNAYTAAVQQGLFKGSFEEFEQQFGGGRSNNRLNESQQRAASLEASMQEAINITQDEFGSLQGTWNQLGARASQAGYANIGSLLMDETAQMAQAKLTSIAQAYLYAASGTAAPDPELLRNLNNVMPTIFNGPRTLELKFKTLQALIQAVKIRASGQAFQPVQLDQAVEAIKRVEAIEQPNTDAQILQGLGVTP